MGGGTGLPVVLRGLLQLAGPHPRWRVPPHLTAIVTVTDDGGNSGRLRRDLGMLPPGDVRNCLAALAAVPDAMEQLLQYRFTGANSLNGHAVGNLLLAAMTQMTGDFAAAVDQLSRLLNVRGRVLPSTRENVTLKAEFEGGEQREGETAITARRAAIKRMWLARSARPLPDAIRALVNADAIVVGPGSLYTSVLPNLLIDGVAATLSGVNAVRIYVANLMTEPGETEGFSLQDHLRILHDHVGMHLFDYVLVNHRPLAPATVADYGRRGARPVHVDASEWLDTGVRIVERDLASSYDGRKIRHAPGPLGRAILDVISQGRPCHAPAVHPQPAGALSREDQP
jgi:uncharacterized cofD-like protein